MRALFALLIIVSSMAQAKVSEVVSIDISRPGFLRFPHSYHMPMKVQLNPDGRFFAAGVHMVGMFNGEYELAQNVLTLHFKKFGISKADFAECGSDADSEQPDGMPIDLTVTLAFTNNFLASARRFYAPGSEVIAAAEKQQRQDDYESIEGLSKEETATLQSGAKALVEQKATFATMTEVGTAFWPYSEPKTPESFPGEMKEGEKVHTVTAVAVIGANMRLALFETLVNASELASPEPRQPVIINVPESDLKPKIKAWNWRPIVGGVDTAVHFVGGIVNLVAGIIYIDRAL